MRNKLLLPSVLLLMACSFDGIVSVDDPDGGARELDMRSIKTKSGAVGMYQSSIASLRRALSELSRDVALFTDEVQVVPYYEGRVGVSNSEERLDSRTTTSADAYGNMAVRFNSAFYQYANAARVQAAQSRALLREYGDSSTMAILANAYAVEGYALIFLAENGCSGIPLTSIPFEGTVEYTTGYTTSQLFRKARELFDSALSITHDSLRFYTLARVGSGRASLGLEEFDMAALAVADVDETYPPFTLAYTDAFTPGGASQETYFWTTTANALISLTPLVNGLFVENGEGINGMEWLSSPGELQDPRVPVALSTSIGGYYQQRKFVGGSPELIVGSSIEAKMIMAEAILNRDALSGTAWLIPLNEARRSIGLVDTADPGNSKDRIDLLFRERAFWFYLTGTRLGDLRRLVRQYGRSPHEVFPVGEYTKGDASGSSRILFYGDHFVFAPPVSEVEYNDQYDGCEHYNP